MKKVTQKKGYCFVQYIFGFDGNGFCTKKMEKRGDIVLKHSNTKGDFFNLGIKNDWKNYLTIK